MHLDVLGTCSSANLRPCRVQPGGLARGTLALADDCLRPKGGRSMAYDKPDDPFMRDSAFKRSASLDNKLEPDPELSEGPVSSTRVALLAAGIAIVLGAVFYGLNNSSTNPAGTGTASTPSAPASSTAQSNNTANPAAPAGMRDVTPRSNNQPGTTTGTAPAAPPTPSGANGSAPKQ